MRFGRRAPDSGLRRPVRWGLAVGAAVAMFVTTSAALAAFSSLASNGATLSTKRIFAGVRSAWPSDVRDASGGAAETISSDVLSYADAQGLLQMIPATTMRTQFALPIDNPFESRTSF